MDENGEEKHYYQGPIAWMFVDQQYNHIKSFLEESAKKEIIPENDARNLLPAEPTPHTAPDCARSGGPFFIGSLFVIMMYLRGYLVISEAT